MCKYLIFKHFFDDESNQLVKQVNKEQEEEGQLDDPEYAFHTMIKLMKQNKVSDHPALLCIDNAEGLIENEEKKFKHFITKTLNLMPNMSIMITSRRPLGVFENCDFQERYFLVEPLKARDSVKLFKKISEDEIHADEVLELMQASPEYPY